MHKGRLLILVMVSGVLVGVAAMSFFFGDVYALGSLSVRQVTPDQLAQAMKADEFYSHFREDTLLVRGPVASVYANAGGITLKFETHGGMTTLCGLDQYPTGTLRGKTVTVVTEGAKAQRVSSGVFLSNCVIETPYS
jgi:hypothetical protein